MRMNMKKIALLLLTLIALKSFAQTDAATTARLMEAAQSGDLKTVKELSAKKTDLNVQGEQKLTALMQATATGRMEVVKFLLGKKVDLELKNEVGDTALAMAVGNEQEAATKALIKAGARLDVSCGDGTLLMCAVKTNDVKTIGLILKKHPGELAKQDASGKTAKDYAKELGTKETRKALGK